MLGHRRGQQPRAPSGWTCGWPASAARPTSLALVRLEPRRGLGRQRRRRWRASNSARFGRRGRLVALAPGGCGLGPALAELRARPRGSRPAPRTADRASPGACARPSISSAPSGLPWAGGCRPWSGAPLPMIVLQAISDGRSVLPARRWIAASIAPGSWPSTRVGVPAVGLEAGQLVVRDGERGRAVDRDAVVVEQDDQPVQLAGGRRASRLVADALHQAAVAGDDLGAVVDELVAEAGGQMALGHGHADRVGQALAQRPGRGLDARRRGRTRDGPAVRAAELAEALAAPPSSCPGSRSGGAARRAASSRGRPTARSGRGRASRMRPGRTSGTWSNSTVATSAMPIGMPGWPEFAFSTASIAKRADRVREDRVTDGAFGQGGRPFWPVRGRARRLRRPRGGRDLVGRAEKSTALRRPGPETRCAVDGPKPICQLVRDGLRTA